ncbi:MAG TPA: hypothetical protein VF254_11240 [Gammaproteobacteria bacterium]
MKDSIYGIALEGWPFVVAGLAAAAWLVTGSSPAYAVLPAALCVLAVMKFRDPDRDVSSAFGALSPVDGCVLKIEREAGGTRVLLRVALFGAYLFRSPTEGKVLEPGPENGGHGFRIRTDEGDEVLLRLTGSRWLPADAIVDYGERVGQGQRCGVLRAARFAEVVLPASATLAVETGERVRAGETVLGRFHVQDRAT